MKHTSERAKAAAGLSLWLCLLVLAPIARADGCGDLDRQLKPYEREVKAAIRDEPEDLPKEVERYAKARRRSQTERAMRIDQKIRSGFLALQSIAPPALLRKSHDSLIAYYRAGVAALDAQDGDETARDAAEIDLWLGLKGYFIDVRDLFVRHECMLGDVEAIDKQLLPELDRRIDDLRGRLSTP